MNAQQTIELAYLNKIHESAKIMGLDDTEIIRLAATDGGFDPVSWDAYVAQFNTCEHHMADAPAQPWRHPGLTG